MPMIDVSCGVGAIITHPGLVNLRGCRIGSGSRIGPFVEILPGTVIGQNCKISSHSTLCGNVHLGDGVFVGHGVVVTDEHGDDDGSEPPPTVIGGGASIGSRATILAGRVIGRGAMIGAGAVVIDDVPDFAIVVGVPGRVIGDGRSGPSTASSRDESPEGDRTSTPTGPTA